MEKKKRIYLVVIIIIFVLGIAIMLYPFVSNWWNQRGQNVVINDYTSAIEALNQEKIDAEREACVEYNQSLLGSVVLTDPFDPNTQIKEAVEYEARLNIDGDGVMGYIKIPKINVELAIYHGTSSEVLEKGAGHLLNTSLPVGGTATHAALSTHTGYANAALFTNLIDLEEGDVFYLAILNEILEYQVDQIKVVEPSDTSDLVVDRNEDYVTLVTCTPYGVNSHRLLVRGTRIPYDVGLDEDVLADNNESFLPYIIAVIILLVLIVIIIVVRKKRRRKRSDEE